ncbi:MAG: hypothetical protein QOD69_3129 [Solirubrobacteraceae bacterium]|nr:hypothetical protein [Solirubrobacteraceae bacterium]
MNYTANLDRRRFRLYVLELAGLALACVVVAVVVGGTATVIGGVGALLYGAGAVFTGAYVHRNPPVIAADGHGARLRGNAPIPWADVERVSVSDGGPGKRAVVVFVRDPARHIAALSGMRARQAQRRLKRFGSPCAVPERELVEPPDVVADAVERIRQTASA